MTPFLFGAEATETATQLISAVGNAGAFGLLAWIVTKGIPSWISSMQRERDSDRQIIQVSQSELIRAFREESRYEREACEKRFNSLTELLSEHHQFALESIATIKKHVE
jgi:hypothetical protein